MNLRKTLSLRVKVVYIAMQGAFLPLIVFFQHYLDCGKPLTAAVLFLVYEVLVFLDAILAIRIFGK